VYRLHPGGTYPHHHNINRLSGGGGYRVGSHSTEAIRHPKRQLIILTNSVAPSVVAASAVIITLWRRPTTPTGRARWLRRVRSDAVDMAVGTAVARMLWKFNMRKCA